MVIVYPLTSQNDYTELKYSLRSVEKFIKKPYEIVIIGDIIPEWIVNVTHINLPDVQGKKQLSIRRKILAALEYAKEILFLNDDIFFLKHWDNFPYYWHGMLTHYSESGTKPLLDKLIELKKPIKHYDGHYPLIYKQDFKEASEHFREDCIIKSLYCNFNEIEGEFVPDCKARIAKRAEDIRLFIKDKPCFSTGMNTINAALPMLEELFCEKSNFEL